MVIVVVMVVLVLVMAEVICGSCDSGGGDDL